MEAVLDVDKAKVIEVEGERFANSTWTALASIRFVKKLIEDGRIKIAEGQDEYFKKMDQYIENFNGLL